jgi:Na+/H+-dicarboxylate symporter
MRKPTAVLVALVVGAILGAIARLPSATALAWIIQSLEPVGTVFIRLVTMVVIPLVVASLFVGVASLDDIRRLGRIGGSTLAYFVVTTAAAAVVGVVVALALRVGGTSHPLASVPGQGTGGLPGLPGLGATLLSVVPDNLIAAAARGDLLPVLIGVCLFGIAATTISANQREPLLVLFRAIDRLSGVVLGWIMWLAPPAVLILIAAAVQRTGASLLGDLAWFALVVVIALAAHVVVVLAPALVFEARQRIGEFVRQTSNAVVLAFSTAASSVALPLSLTAAERLSVPPEVSGLVLPVGATVNKNGAAVYKAVTAVCVAHWAGMTVDAGMAARIVVAATFAAFTGAGVPGSSLVTTLLVLRSIGLEAQASAAIALVAGIDRPLDMCRTAVNTIGNLVGACVVTRTAATRG